MFDAMTHGREGCPSGLENCGGQEPSKCEGHRIYIACSRSRGVRQAESTARQRCLAIPTKSSSGIVEGALSAIKSQHGGLWCGRACDTEARRFKFGVHGVNAWVVSHRSVGRGVSFSKSPSARFLADHCAEIAACTSTCTSELFVSEIS